jgi:hypothetical protein
MVLQWYPQILVTSQPSAMEVAVGRNPSCLRIHGKASSCEIYIGEHDLLRQHAELESGGADISRIDRTTFRPNTISCSTCTARFQLTTNQVHLLCLVSSSFRLLRRLLSGTLAVFINCPCPGTALPRSPKHSSDDRTPDKLIVVGPIFTNCSYMQIRKVPFLRIYFFTRSTFSTKGFDDA